MPYQTFSGTLRDCTDRLNGALQLGPFPTTGLAVGALTLDFDLPVNSTVTFSGSAGDVLDIDTIISEINTSQGAGFARKAADDAGPHANVFNIGYVPRVKIVMQADAGITIVSTSTANALLGLSTTANTTRTIVAATDVVAFGPDTHAGHYVLVIAP